MCFVFHITFPLPHYSLSVLGLFYIHTLPFNSFSRPTSLLSLPFCLYFLLTHSSFNFFSFVSSVFNIFPLLSSHAPLPFPSLLCITSTVKARHYPSKLELGCLYSERSQVQSASWEYQNKSHRLSLLSSSPGSITTSLPIPITSDTAGNYTCTLQLKNGQTVWATQAVTLPREGGRDGMISQRLVCFLIFFISRI